MEQSIRSSFCFAFDSTCAMISSTGMHCGRNEWSMNLAQLFTVLEVDGISDPYNSIEIRTAETARRETVRICAADLRRSHINLMTPWFGSERFLQYLAGEIGHMNVM